MTRGKKARPFLSVFFLFLLLCGVSQAAVWDKKADSLLNTEKSPTSITAADLDGDNVPEIAFGLSSSIRVIKGLGAWSLKSEIPASSPWSLTAADADGDNNQDLAFVSPSINSVAFAAGKGDGTFDAPVAYVTGTSPQSVALGDFDGDGKTDAAVAERDANRIEIFYDINRVGGPSVVQFTAGASPVSVAVGDFNGDGKPDMVSANSGDNTVSLFINDGAGGFSGTDLSAGTEPSSAVAADLNGDGRPDMAVAGYASNGVTVFWGNGDGTFITDNPVIIPVGQGPVFLLAADLDGDGNDDLISANSQDDTVTVAMSRGDGTFYNPNSYPVGAGPVSLAVADFDGDGVKDIAAANKGGASLTFLYGVVYQDGPQLSFTQDGASVTLTAALYDMGAPVPGRTISVYSSTDGGVRWAKKASGLTLADGTFTKALRMAKGSYRLRAESGGVYSPVLGCVVQPVTVAAQERNATTTDSTPLLSWTAFPGATGYVMQTSSSGRFPAGSYRESPDTGNVTSTELPAEMALTKGARTYWRVVALLPTGKSMPSAPRYITYKEGTSITVTDIGNSGSSVKPSAVLAGAVTGPLSGKTVYFYYKKDDAAVTAWTSLGYGKTDLNGSATIKAPKPLPAGFSYLIKAVFKGDTLYGKAEAVVPFAAP